MSFLVLCRDQIMRFAVNNKQVCGIVGLPRSGTTVVSSICNSAVNAFAVVEPVWIYKSNKSNYITSDKFGTIDLTGDVIMQIRGLLNRFDVCAVKETFRIYEICCVDDIFNKTDTIIAVYRDPVSAFNSWRRNNWAPLYNNIDYFITNYERFDTLVRMASRERQTYVIDLEKLCVGRKEFWNNNVVSLPIDGELQLIKNRDSVNFGDIRARDSEQIDAIATIASNNLNSHEIALLNKNLRPIYDRMLANLR
jgi:hypothetical protein